MRNRGAYKIKIDQGYCRRLSGDYDNGTLNSGYAELFIESILDTEFEIKTWSSAGNQYKVSYKINTINHPDGHFRLDYVGGEPSYNNMFSFQYHGYAETYEKDGLFYIDYNQPIFSYPKINYSGTPTKQLQAFRIIRSGESGYGRVIGTNSGDNGTFSYNEKFFLKKQASNITCYSRNDYYLDVSSYMLYDRNYNRISMVMDNGSIYSDMIVSYTHQDNASNSGQDYSGWSDNLTYSYGKLSSIPCFDNNTSSCVRVRDVTFDDFSIPSGSKVLKVGGGNPKISIGDELFVKQYMVNKILKEKPTTDCSNSGLSLTDADALSLPEDNYKDPNNGNIPSITEITVVDGVLQ